MSITITEKDLPSNLTAGEAVEAAYSQELAEVASKLVRGLPTLIECDKELAPYLFMNVRNRLPQVIENLFVHWLSILGISRNRLRHLITQKESRKFGKDFSPWQLYKYVSGVNAVRLRRLLSTLEGEDYPADPKRAYHQVRQATLSGNMEIPAVDLEKDIGGYKKVKQ